MSDTTLEAMVARLNHIEISLYGTTLSVQAAPKRREHKCVPPLPSILEPDIAESAAFATGALAEMIAHEAEKLALLRRGERITRALHAEPGSMTDEMREDLREVYRLLNDQYATGGTTDSQETLGQIASDAAQPIGYITGERLRRSDGRELWIENGGFLENYMVRSEEDLDDAIARHTCYLCLPNFQDMLDWDRAHGLLKARRGDGGGKRDDDANAPDGLAP